MGTLQNLRVIASRWKLHVCRKCRSESLRSLAGLSRGPQTAIRVGGNSVKTMKTRSYRWCQEWANLQFRPKLHFPFFLELEARFFVLVGSVIVRFSIVNLPLYVLLLVHLFRPQGPVRLKQFWSANYGSKRFLTLSCPKSWTFQLINFFPMFAIFLSLISVSPVFLLHSISKNIVFV